MIKLCISPKTGFSSDTAQIKPELMSIINADLTGPLIVARSLLIFLL